jgi:NAD(P)-dependent dehydrogenase (short-subunit alcohol dehydrogenase family)
MKFEGKVAIVTGGSQGIGKAIALSLAKEGCNVVICARNIVKLEKAKTEIMQFGKEVLAIKGDVSISADVKQVVETTLEKFKQIDILVNNAGVASMPYPSEALPESEWDRTINIDLKGVFYFSKAVAQDMIKRKKGKIVNIASIGGIRGLPKSLPYAAAKGGVIQLTRTLGAEWAKYNINVNAICPGLVNTPMIQLMPGEMKKNFMKSIPQGKFSEPEDIANAVLFLAGPESDNITGQIIVCDGGAVAVNPGFL